MFSDEMKQDLLKEIDTLLALTTVSEVASAIRRFMEDFYRKHVSPEPPESLCDEFYQIEDSRTIERAHYYLRRLKKGLLTKKTTAFSDINLNRWKDYPEILTDSLWIMDKRTSDKDHKAAYHGNFIPQIPNQLIQRFTKGGEWVLDPFCGAGTTLIEAHRLGRKAMGVDLNPEVLSAHLSSEAIRNIVGGQDSQEPSIVALQGDAKTFDFRQHHKANGGSGLFDFIILHPPYYNIIKFSDDENDLSNTDTRREFLALFANCVRNVAGTLRRGRHLALVIGDVFKGGEWIPLGFKCMEVVQESGLILKSIIVKNFNATLGKRDTKDLWRYRALAGGYYVFKHEYVMIFQKPK